ncbi:MAG TPA: hypothetical protein VEA41_01830 [Salinarimonas sp.]|nr:hypothetical protein [Salinarimonas sp.]
MAWQPIHYTPATHGPADLLRGWMKGKEERRQIDADERAAYLEEQRQRENRERLHHDDYRGALKAAQELMDAGQPDAAAAVLARFRRGGQWDPVDLGDKPQEPVQGGSAMPDGIENAQRGIKPPVMPGLEAIQQQQLEEGSKPGAMMGPALGEQAPNPFMAARQAQMAQAPQAAPANPIMAARQAQQAQNAKRAEAYRQGRRFTDPWGNQVTLDPMARENTRRAGDERQMAENAAIFDQHFMQSDDPVIRKYASQLRPAIISTPERLDTGKVLDFIRMRADRDAQAEIAARNRHEDKEDKWAMAQFNAKEAMKRAIVAGRNAAARADKPQKPGTDDLREISRLEEDIRDLEEQAKLVESNPEAFEEMRSAHINFARTEEGKKLPGGGLVVSGLKTFGELPITPDQAVKSEDGRKLYRGVEKVTNSMAKGYGASITDSDRSAARSEVSLFSSAPAEYAAQLRRAAQRLRNGRDLYLRNRNMADGPAVSPPANQGKGKGKGSGNPIVRGNDLARINAALADPKLPPAKRAHLMRLKAKAEANGKAK